MAISDFKIGTTLGGLVNIESLTTPLPIPRAPFKPWVKSVTAASGQSIGKGFPNCQWIFSKLATAERDELRTYCTGNSATVYIRTRTNESSDAFANYQAVMHWPDDEKRDPSVKHDRLEMTISFTNLVLQS